MKRIISFLLCLVTVFLLMPFAIPAEALLYRKGDLNADNTVNAKDAYSMALYLSGNGAKVTSDLGDLNFDDNVNAKDYYIMKLHLSGITDIEDAPGFGGYTVAENPIGEYTVVITDPSNANMVFAANELCKYVKAGDGTELSVAEVSSNAEKQIVLASDTTGEMGTDGFNIRVEDDDLYITGGAKRGTMYAVNEILESYLGYSFYAYGKTDLDLYSAKDIAKDTDITHIPTVRYRSITIEGFGSAYVETTTVKRNLSGATGISALQNAKYGYGVERLFANAHSFDVFIPLDELYEKTGLSHRCVSNDTMVDICAEHMIALVDARIASGQAIGNEITEISCSYADSDTPCPCKNCRKILNVEKNHSGALVRFVNKVHEKFSAVYPDITFVTNAYGTWHDAPAVTSLNEGIVLLYCWNGCANHMLGKEGCTEKGNSLGTTNVKTEADFLAWKEKCSEIYVWYYPTQIYYMLCPQPNFFNLYNDFNWFIDNGAVGFYVKGSDGCSFETLDGYLISLLMWDPDISEEEYSLKLKEYLRCFYGYGWEYIYEYMEMLTECGDLKGCVLNDFELPFDIYSKTYFSENYATMKELFEKAMSRADTQEQKDNIERLSVHMHFLGLSATYEKDYVNGTGETKAQFSEKWQELYDYINDNGIRTAHDTVGIPAEFTLEINPMTLVYPLVGTGER